MVKSVRIKFDKIYHDTGKAILISIANKDHWLPKKLCRNLVINSKLGGNVCIPTFIAEKIGLNVEDCKPDIEVIHHIPEPKDKTNINHDSSLFK
jgi:hypothetical protein